LAANRVLGAVRSAARVSPVGLGHHPSSTPDFASSDGLEGLQERCSGLQFQPLSA